MNVVESHVQNCNHISFIEGIENNENNGQMVESTDTTVAASQGANDKTDPKCVLCRNHGIEVSVKGHKNRCIFVDCCCDKCCLAIKVRDVMSKNAKLRRSITKIRPLHLKTKNLCAKCQNHGIWNSFAKHKDCAFMDCKCEKCAIIQQRSSFSVKFDQMVKSGNEYNSKSGHNFKLLAESVDTNCLSLVSPTTSCESQTECELNINRRIINEKTVPNNVINNCTNNYLINSSYELNQQNERKDIYGIRYEAKNVYYSPTQILNSFRQHIQISGIDFDSQLSACVYCLLKYNKFDFEKTKLEIMASNWEINATVN